ncbi:hypothetical protein ACN47E_009185 [Coniothyrium glycines]
MAGKEEKQDQVQILSLQTEASPLNLPFQSGASSPERTYGVTAMSDLEIKPGYALQPRPHRVRTEREQQQRRARVTELLNTTVKIQLEQMKANTTSVIAEQPPDQRRVDSGVELDERRRNSRPVTEPYTPPPSRETSLPATSKDVYPVPLPYWARPPVVVKLPGKNAATVSLEEGRKLNRIRTEQVQCQPKIHDCSPCKSVQSTSVNENAPRYQIMNGRPRPQYNTISYRTRPRIQLSQPAQRLNNPTPINRGHANNEGSMSRDAALFVPGQHEHTLRALRNNIIATRMASGAHQSGAVHQPLPQPDSDEVASGSDVHVQPRHFTWNSWREAEAFVPREQLFPQPYNTYQASRTRTRRNRRALGK